MAYLSSGRKTSARRRNHPLNRAVFDVLEPRKMLAASLPLNVELVDMITFDDPTAGTPYMDFMPRADPGLGEVAGVGTIRSSANLVANTDYYFVVSGGAGFFRDGWTTTTEDDWYAVADAEFIWDYAAAPGTANFTGYDTEFPSSGEDSGLGFTLDGTDPTDTLGTGERKPGLGSSFSWETSRALDNTYILRVARSEVTAGEPAKFRFYSFAAQAGGSLTDDREFYPASGGFSGMSDLTVHIYKETDPADVAADSPSGAGLVKLGENRAGGRSTVPRFASTGVRYFDGALSVESSDISSASFGSTWGHTRVWSNAVQTLGDGANGNGWYIAEQPYLKQVLSGSTVTGLEVVLQGGEKFTFDVVGSTITPRDPNIGISLSSTSSTAYLLDLGDGSSIKFHSFDTSIPAAQRGKFAEMAEEFIASGGTAYANKTEARYDSTTGELEEIRRLGVPFTDGMDLVTPVETFTYTFDDLPGTPARRVISSVRWSQYESLDGGATVSLRAHLRESEYEYYEGTNTGSDIGGTRGDLKRATVYALNPTTGTNLGVVDRSYYRYYVSASEGSSSGYAAGLKYEFNTATYERMLAAPGLGLPDSISISDFVSGGWAAYADRAFEYNTDKQVTEVSVRGTGSSNSSSATGVFAYSYAEPRYDFAAWNDWTYKTIETRPDGSARTIYANRAGMAILSEVVTSAGNTGGRWISAYRYDESIGGLPGTLKLIAEADAMITGSAAGELFIVDSDDNNDGVETGETDTVRFRMPLDARYTAFSYFSDGYLASRQEIRFLPNAFSSSFASFIHPGTAGSKTEYGYTTETVGTGPSAKSSTLPSSMTRSGSDYFSISRQSLLRYKYVEDTTRVSQRQAASGVGSDASHERVWYDDNGRVIYRLQQPDDVSISSNSWLTEGYLTAFEYDPWTGAEIKRSQYLQEATVNSTTDLPDVPSGDVLVTRTEVDLLGRPVKVASPRTVTVGSNSRYLVDYYIYNDYDANTSDSISVREVRVYSGVLAEIDTGGAIGDPSDNPTSTDVSNGLGLKPVEITRINYSTGVTEVLSMSAGAIGSSWPSATATIIGVQTLGRTLTNIGGQTTAERQFHTVSSAHELGTTNFESGSQYYEDTWSYDLFARVVRHQSGTGTVTRNVLDGLGRVQEVWVGTDDTPTTGSWSPSNLSGTNLTPTVSYEYDGTGIGVGLVTGFFSEPYEFDNFRGVFYYYDWQNRLIAEKAGIHAYLGNDLGENTSVTYYERNVFGEVTAKNVYDGDSVDISNSDSEFVNVTGIDSDRIPDRLALTEQINRTIYTYDSRGRLVQSDERMNLSTSSLDNGRTTATWYDRRGNVVKTRAATGLVTKYSYDGANRLVRMLSTDGRDDSWTWGGDQIAQASTWTDDTVLEETVLALDASGNITAVEKRERFHDGFGYGSLGDETDDRKTAGTSGSSSGMVAAARVSYTWNYYDSGNRLVTTVNLGTNGGTTPTRPAAASDSANNRANNALRTDYRYNEAGWLRDVIKPRSGEVTALNDLFDRYEYDALGRTITLVENYVNGVASSGERDLDRVTRYTYRADGQTLTVTADLHTADQVTEYLYGGSGSGAFANDMLTGVVHPYTSGPAPADTYVRNVHGDIVSITDRRGVVRVLSYNSMGRLVRDAVTSFGSSGIVDTLTEAITWQYDPMGRPTYITTLADEDAVINQVLRKYNVFGQVIAEYQEHDGAVTEGIAATEEDEAIPGSLVVQYIYDTAEAEHGSRQTHLYYPREYETSSPFLSRYLAYEYGDGGAGDRIGRLAQLRDPNTSLLSNSVSTVEEDHTIYADASVNGFGSSDWYATKSIEQYAYLGVATPVIVRRPEPGVQLSYLTAGGGNDTSSPSYSGDIYGGLDRFGRVRDQRWVTLSQSSSGVAATETSTYWDRFVYGHDRGGNVLFKENLVSTTRSELYHANGATAGYDALDRLTGFRRGALSDTNSDGMYDTVTSSSRTQVWSLSSLGNWDSVTTGSTTETRTHDINNRITDRSASGSPVDPTYDSAGNLTKNGNSSNLTYNAWGKIVAATAGSGSLAGTWTWEYDGLGRRIQTKFVEGGISSLTAGPGESGGEEETEGDSAASEPWDGISVVGSEALSGVTRNAPPAWWKKLFSDQLVSSGAARFPVGPQLESSETGREFSTVEDSPPGLVSGASVTDLYYTTGWQLIEERIDGVISRQNVFSPVYIDAMILRDRDIDMEEQFEGDDSLGYTFDERLYAHHDANFNVTSIARDTSTTSTPTWAVAERYLNDAYGAATVFSPSYGLQSGNTYRWQTFHQGLRWEGSVGLYDNRNRFLSTSLGRFNKDDPLGFVDGLNLQQYVKGNPVNSLDPSGLQDAGGGWQTPGPSSPGNRPPDFDPRPDLYTPPVWEAAVLNVANKFAILSYFGGGGVIRGGAMGTRAALQGPTSYFRNKTAQEASEVLAKKFGPPKSVRKGAETYYNPKTQRSFNVHTDPSHGSPHIDIRHRGGYAERRYDLWEDMP